MARVSGASDMARHSIGGGDTSTPIDAASAELSQLLRRLQDTVLHPTPEREKLLRRSEFERDRLGTNLEYARSSLAQLEADASSGKPAARKLQAHGTLAAQRDVLELLLDRLQDLRQMAEQAQDDDDDEDSSDDEDLLGGILPASNEATEQQATEIPEETHEEPSIPEPEAAREPPAATQPTPTDTTLPVQTTAPSTQTSQTLRGRRTAEGQSNTAAAAAASSPSPTSGHTTARAALFANRRKPAPPETSTATAEAILDNQRAEQDVLSEAILKMAGALKASSHKFSDTLEADKEVLGRAGEGIEKTEQSMDAARGRMGTLRKMTEGKGWWGRIILYAWVYGLMLSLLLLVFVFPKLRF